MGCAQCVLCASCWVQAVLTTILTLGIEPQLSKSHHGDFKALAQDFAFKCARTLKQTLITPASEVNSLFILKGHCSAVVLTVFPNIATLTRQLVHSK